MASPPTPPPTAADLQANPETPSAPNNTSPGTTPQIDPSLAQSDAPPSSSTQTTPLSQDSNHIAFNTIFQLCSSQDLSFIDYAERAEISSNAPTSLSRLLITCPLVLGYLITDNLTLAHVALNRLPPTLSPHPLVRALMSLLAAIHKREHSTVYTRADGLVQIITRSDFFEPRLATVVVGLKDLFIYAVRKRTFELLSKAYNSIPISIVEANLGLSSKAVLEAASNNGWSYDASTQILRPAKFQDQTILPSLGPSNLDSFSAVVDAVGRMESW